MGDQVGFVLETLRATIEKALAEAGFDVVADASEPNLIQARRDRGRDSTTVIIDGGGSLRYTRTRQAAADQTQTRRAGGRTFRVVRERSETATVCRQLTPEDGMAFADLLATLDRIV